MAAYAAMVYNANRPPGYPAIAVIPDHAARLAEEINSVVSGSQVRKQRRRQHRRSLKILRGNAGNAHLPSPSYYTTPRSLLKSFNCVVSGSQVLPVNIKSRQGL